MTAQFDLSQLAVPEGIQLKPTMTTCTIEGQLEEDDLRQLIALSGDILPDEDDPSDLKKIREKHHHVARLVADGMAQRLVASITGYSESYISVLLNNPSMAELVEFYRIKNGAAIDVVVEKLKTVGLKALERLDARVEADELDNNELISAAKLGFDRSGHGPASKQHIVDETHIFDHAKLAELNKEAKRRNSEYIVPQEEVREALRLPSPAETGAEKYETDETVEAGTDDADGSIGQGDSAGGEQEAGAGIPSEDLSEASAADERSGGDTAASGTVVSVPDGTEDA